jgi:hypothetical protein
MSEHLNADMREVAKRLDLERGLRRVVALLTRECVRESLPPWLRKISRRVISAHMPMPRAISEGKE